MSGRAERSAVQYRTPLGTGPLWAQQELRLSRLDTGMALRAIRSVVEVNGIEPMTSCLQSRRSPN
jgi:hypothetical protein